LAPPLSGSGGRGGRRKGILPIPHCLSHYPTEPPFSIPSLFLFLIRPYTLKLITKITLPLTIIPLGYLIKPSLYLNIIIRSFSFKIKY
jgi:hypothetical protein